MMDDILVKAHDIIIENQRNADTKANIFIILLTGFLTFIDSIPIQINDGNKLVIYQQIYFIMIIPLLLFILSLIPIFSHNFKIKVKQKKPVGFNIFYWRSIAGFKDCDEFIKAYIAKLENGSKTVSEFDRDLLKQIYVNSMILEYKNSSQRFAFFIITEFLLLFISSTIAYFFFNSNLFVLFGMFIIFNVLSFFNVKIILYSSKVIKWVKVRISKIKKKKQKSKN
jgi:hypothetical protein